MDDFVYPDPVQGGDQPVTRQRALDPTQQASVDPMPFPAIIQGSPEIHTTRNVGNGAGRFGPDGTLYSDHLAPSDTVYVDGPVIAVGEPAQPPALAISDQPMPPPAHFVADHAAAGAPPAVPPLAGVVQADQPGERGADPRDAGGGPIGISGAKLPVILKAPIVRVDQAAPKAKKARR